MSTTVLSHRHNNRGKHFGINVSIDRGGAARNHRGFEVKGIHVSIFGDMLGRLRNRGGAARNHLGRYLGKVTSCKAGSSVSA
jgi:hypothetical protein